MEYIIKFNDAKHGWAVIINDYGKPGLIGHYYIFKPFKGIIVTDKAYDEADIHYVMRGKKQSPQYLKKQKLLLILGG